MATAESYAPTGPRHYVWWFPGSPVKVHLHLHLVERLQDRCQNAGHGIAEEGLLFGRTVDGATEISDFQPASGRSISDLIASLPAESGKRLLVGYYRTEPGPVLRLHENDLALAKSFFPKPYQVFLVIQPNSFAPPNAAFFFHDGSQRMAEYALMEFPFDASMLATEEQNRIKRHQQATSTPAVVPPPAPEESPVRQKSAGLKIAAWLAALVILAAAALFTAVPSLRQQFLAAISRPAPATSGTAAPQPSLGLHARRQDRDLELTWNRESAWVAAATSAVISIDDGASRRQIPLDPSGLRNGSILYSPSTDQVLIQLSVTAPTGTAAESVRVILAQSEAPRVYSVSSTVPKNPPAPPETVPLAQASKPFSAPPPSPASSPAAPSLNDPPALRTNPNAAAAAPVVDILRTPAIAPPPPPAQTRVQPQAQPQSPSQPQTLPQAPPSTPTPAQPEPSAPATPANVTYHPPVPTRQVGPSFPAELRSVTLKPEVVEVRVTIDKTGRVVKAEALTQNVHRFFIDEAIHAARLWRFQPAQRGEEAVQSESILHFVFTR